MVVYLTLIYLSLSWSLLVKASTNDGNATFSPNQYQYEVNTIIKCQCFNSEMIPKFRYISLTSLTAPHFRYVKGTNYTEVVIETDGITLPLTCYCPPNHITKKIIVTKKTNLCMLSANKMKCKAIIYPQNQDTVKQGQEIKCNMNIATFNHNIMKVIDSGLRHKVVINRIYMPRSDTTMRISYYKLDKSRKHSINISCTLYVGLKLHYIVEKAYMIEGKQPENCKEKITKVELHHVLSKNEIFCSTGSLCSDDIYAITFYDTETGKTVIKNKDIVECKGINGGVYFIFCNVTRGNITTISNKIKLVINKEPTSISFIGLARTMKPNSAFQCVANGYPPPKIKLEVKGPAELIEKDTSNSSIIYIRSTDVKGTYTVTCTTSQRNHTLSLESWFIIEIDTDLYVSYGFLACIFMGIVLLILPLIVKELPVEFESQLTETESLQLYEHKESVIPTVPFIISKPNRTLDVDEIAVVRDDHN